MPGSAGSMASLGRGSGRAFWDAFSQCLSMAATLKAFSTTGDSTTTNSLPAKAPCKPQGSPGICRILTASQHRLPAWPRSARTPWLATKTCCNAASLAAEEPFASWPPAQSCRKRARGTPVMGTSARPWARLGSKLRTGRRRGEDEEQGASQGHGVRVGLGRASATFADSTVAFCIPMSPMLLLDSYLCAEIHHGSASHTQNSWCDPSGNAHAGTLSRES